MLSVLQSGRSQVTHRTLRGCTSMTCLLGVSTAFGAGTAAPGKDMAFDFKAKQITITGFYAPQSTTPSKKTGLETELEARKNGLASLADYLAKSCETPEAGVPADALKLQSNWKTALRSQGSEIYPNGALKIILTVNLREVFKMYSSTKPKVFKTAEGAPLYFSIPKLPATAVKCGLVKFSISPRKSIYVAPVYVTATGTNAKIVQLNLADGNVLQAASQDDLTVLQKSDLSKFDTDAASTQTGSDVVELPVSGG